jgi:hypothetical protein
MCNETVARLDDFGDPRSGPACDPGAREAVDGGAAAPDWWQESVDDEANPNTAAQPPTHEALARLGWQINSRKHRLVKLCAVFERELRWVGWGLASAAHWIAPKLQVTLRTAREWIHVGHALDALPALDKAFADGVLSYAKVRVLARFADDDNVDDLIELARKRPAGRLGAAIAKHLTDSGDEPDHERDQRHRDQRALHIETDPDGTIFGSFCLTPLEGQRLLAAVDERLNQKPSEPASQPAGQREGQAVDDGAAAPPTDQRRSTRWASLAQQRADALVELVTQAVNITTEVVIHVRGDGATFDDGTPLTTSEAARQVPGSFIRALIHDAERTPVNASGRQRHPTDRQKRVVRERDRECVDCGCVILLEYDHVPAYEITRRTVVEELVLRCGPCHRARHRSAAAAAHSRPAPAQTVDHGAAAPDPEIASWVSKSLPLPPPGCPGQPEG